MKPPAQPPGDNGVWTPARLRERLTALKGLAPAPVRYVIYRATSRPTGPEVSGYELPGQPGRSGEAAFERWLLEQSPAAAERLAVSVLVIREQLDSSGLLREGVLERRRGSVEGPTHGNVARVEFTGAARQVLRYRALRDGRLSQLPDQDHTSAEPPPGEPDPDGFSGDDDAVRAYLNEDATILERRAPSAAEDRLGLSAIVHVRRRDGVEIGCGIGWHGDVAFVLAADFPRRGMPSSVPSQLEDVVAAAIDSRDLIRYETRYDELGLCVIARQRGEHSLVQVRPSGSSARIEPYVPGPVASANEDQRRWMTYAEAYEARTVLDSWRNGDGDEVVVITVDPDQQAWRHVIDADGIEIDRRSDNEAAAAVLLREQFNPPDPLSNTSPSPPRTAPAADRFAAGDDVPDGTLLSKVLAWANVRTLFTEITETNWSGTATPAAVRGRLAALVGPLTVLNASFSLGSLKRLSQRARTGSLSRDDLLLALDDLAERIREELALTRTVVLPAGRVTVDGEAPFGSLVEMHFPAAGYDIEEAVACLAMRRSTACVLHAMKVMRHGLLELERLLSTPRLVALNWANLMTAVRHAGGDQHDLIDPLVLVRRAWRAPDLMPADKYTEEEAEAVLAAVAAFMRVLAERIDARREASTG
jgi:hypothetical protein